MPLFVNTSTIRPNRLTPESKDERYHSDWGRWCLQSINHPLHRNFIAKTLTNWSFYKGGDGQWIFEEDLEAFFLDESGDVKNRLKIAKNLIKPMVQQYEGNAIRLSFNAKARATSDFSINRREQELGRLQFYEAAAAAYPDMREGIKDRLPIGETPIETEEIFENSWIEEHESDINNLLKFVAQDIDMDELKIRICKNLAMSGLGIYKGFEQNSRYLGDSIDPLFFFWDLSAKKPDLSDAEYMGEWSYMDAPSLFEKYQNLGKHEREAIERYAQNESGSTQKMVHSYYAISGSKIPVYEVYWKDMEQQEYGYIEDDYGYPHFTRINHEESEYTDKDLIDPPTDAHKKILGNNKKKKRIFVDVLRYCVFIPKEEVGANMAEDIILEWGELPYQEKYAFDPSNVEFPYKCYTWAYDKGEVLSPLDDAIQPQRLINRLISVAESHINNSRGEGTVIAKEAVDPRDGEETLVRNINKSKPIFVDTTRTGSVQNAVGTYGATIGSGTMSIFNIVGELQQGLQDVTGINEAMTGTQGGSDALVGVIQSQIQRGSLVQEPFYHALTTIMRQAHQHIASVGKRIYAENPRRLAIMVGDKGMHNIVMTKDMLMEEFRTFITRSEGEQSAVASGNELLFTLRQMNLIDDIRFANLYGRSDSDQIADSLRDYQKELLQASRMKDKEDAQSAIAQQEEMAAMNSSMMAQEQDAIDRNETNQALSREADINKVLLKEGAKNQREEMKYAANGTPPDQNPFKS